MQTSWRRATVGSATLAAGLVLPVLAAGLSGPAGAAPAASVFLSGTTTLVSVNNDGDQANNFSYVPSVSADGTKVAFTSLASNLVAGAGGGGVPDVFVRDLIAGTTTLVSAAVGGRHAHGFSRDGVISADGRYVAFASQATNIIRNDTHLGYDVYVRDLATATSTLVSAASDGTQGDGEASSPSISRNGRFVAFQSEAPNLVPDDTNGTADVFVHDMVSGRTSRISLPSSGGEGNNTSFDPAISTNGRYVAFTSLASNLVAGDTNGTADIFVRDRVSGDITRVSVASGGGQGNVESLDADISARGRFVAFQSTSSNLVPHDTNAMGDVFVHDAVTNSTRRVSVSAAGRQGNFRSGNPSISAHGGYVAFASGANNLIPGRRVHAGEVYVRSRAEQTTEEVSVTPSGLDGFHWGSFSPSISAGGGVVAFATAGIHFLDVDYNNHRYDIFIRTR